MIEIVVTDEFKGWYEALSIDEQEPVFRVVTLLEELGTTLGFPYTSSKAEALWEQYLRERTAEKTKE